MIGKIIKINSTKYMTLVDNKIYDLTLRGKIRNTKITPFVGDYVKVDLNSKTIEEVLPRKNYLLRPCIANIDYAVIITSTKDPNLDLTLLDKMLVNVIYNNITPLICFTKTDLLNKEELENFIKRKNYYKKIGIKTIINTDKDNFENIVKGKVLVCAGQTGAGKSSFINTLDNLNLKTNPISKALNRGVHTTRYVTLYQIKDYFIADTPGFSALDLNDIPIDDIKYQFEEFNNYDCKYRDCNHINTDGCEVIKSVGKDILLSRYDNYVKFIEERKNK